MLDHQIHELLAQGFSRDIGQDCIVRVMFAPQLIAELGKTFAFPAARDLERPLDKGGM